VPKINKVVIGLLKDMTITPKNVDKTIIRMSEARRQTK
jgi:hypothetical protein